MNIKPAHEDDDPKAHPLVRFGKSTLRFLNNITLGGGMKLAEKIIPKDCDHNQKLVRGGPMTAVSGTMAFGFPLATKAALVALPAAGVVSAVLAAKLVVPVVAVNMVTGWFFTGMFVKSSQRLAEGVAPHWDKFDNDMAAQHGPRWQRVKDHGKKARVTCVKFFRDVKNGAHAGAKYTLAFVGIGKKSTAANENIEQAVPQRVDSKGAEIAPSSKNAFDQKAQRSTKDARPNREAPAAARWLFPPL